MPGEKVLARIISDELTVMSRVSQDRKNWKAICNVSFFEELVNDRIRAYAGKTEVVGQLRVGGDDDTPFETSDVDFNDINAKATEGLTEQLDHARQLEELTANIQKLNAIKKELHLKRKTVVVEKDSDEDQANTEDQNVFIAKPPKKFSLTEIFKGNVRHRRLAIASLVLLVGGLVGSIGYSLYSDHQEQVANELKAKAELEARTKSDYTKATASGQGDSKGKKPTVEELLATAEARLRDKNPTEGQAAVKMALAMNLNSADRAKALALAATISMAMGNFDQASTEYTQSLEQLELSTTLHDAAVLSVKRGDLLSAEKLFLKALQLPSPTPHDRTLTLVSLFEVAASLDQSALSAHKARADKDSVPAPPMTRIAATLTLINEAMATTKSGRDLLLLAKAMSEYYLGHMAEFQTAAIELIDEPLDGQVEGKSASASTELADWPRLVRHCAVVYKNPPVTGFSAAFYASCLSRSHGTGQGLPFAKYAFSVNGKDPLFGSLYATLLFKSGDRQAAEKILTENPSFNHSSKLARALEVTIKGDRTPAQNDAPVDPATPLENSPAQSDQTL